jgi:membrane protease YdiL (CAAX protease family)
MKRTIFFVVFVLLLFAIWKINLPTSAKKVAGKEQEGIPVEFEFFAQNLVTQNDLFSNQPISIKEFSPPAPVFQESMKSPMLAATLGIVPGLGHVYLKDFKTASALAGTAGIGLGLQYGYQERIGLETTCFYSIYSAYRDARIQNGTIGCLPRETLAELALAPFQWSVIKKPEVWGGIVATLALAVGALYLSGNAEPAALDKTDMPYLSLPMSLGEEAFFRGFLQSALSEPCTPWGGIALSSVAFGAAHIRNAFDLPSGDRSGYYAFGIPLLTGLGVYYGWLTYKNHSLKESVAAHTWYNFIVMMTSAWIAHRASIGNQGFAISISY